jgi:DNA-binding response OmpR family regulator
LTRTGDDRGAAATGLEGLRLLLVEDDPMILFALEAVVEDFGCLVAGTAMRVADGLAFATANDFDVAILDLKLADGESDALIAALAARGTPVIVTSGVRTSVHGRSPDGPIFLQKPYTDRDLRKALLEMRRRIGS